MSDTLIDRGLVEVGTTSSGGNVEANDSVSVPPNGATPPTASSADTPPTVETSPVTSTISENTVSDAQPKDNASEVVKSDKAIGGSIGEDSPNVPLVPHKHYSHSKPFFM